MLRLTLTALGRVLLDLRVLAPGDEEAGEDSEVAADAPAFGFAPTRPGDLQAWPGEHDWQATPAEPEDD